MNDHMGKDAEEVRLTDQVHRLCTNIEALRQVLDGTYGSMPEQTMKETKQDIPDVNERLVYVSQNMEKSIELLQGLRERLQRITRQI